MSNLMDRVNRLKSMAGAMKLNLDEDASRMMLEMLSLMGEMAEEMQAMSDAHAELNEYVESLDDDLADLAESLLDGGEDEDGEVSFEDEEDEDEEEDAELEEGEMIIYACPACGHEIEFDPSDVDFDEDYLCPACGKPIFPEVEEDN